MNTVSQISTSATDSLSMVSNKERQSIHEGEKILGKRNKPGSTERQLIEPSTKRTCKEINQIEMYKIGKKL